MVRNRRKVLICEWDFEQHNPVSVELTTNVDQDVLPWKLSVIVYKMAFEAFMMCNHANLQNVTVHISANHNPGSQNIGLAIPATIADMMIPLA